MKNIPKFDIRLSFTGGSLNGSKKNMKNSNLFESLFNKKINIHLKINLDELEQQYNNKKLQNKIPKIEGDNKSEETTKDLKISKINLDSKKGYLNQKQIALKICKSVSNQKNNILNFRKNTLVLDLDETLVYVTDTKNSILGLPQIQFNYYLYDESEKIIKENLKELGINKIKKSIGFITIRPNFNIFMNVAKELYDEIVVFTSGQYSYAEEIIKIIDKQKIISKIYSRKDCSFYNQIFYKDLNKIKDDFSHIIIIDNYPENYLLQPFNGIPIPSFIGDPNDCELLKLLPILEKLSKVKDVRNYIRQIVSYKIQKIDFNKAYQLLGIKRGSIYNIFQIFNGIKDDMVKRNNLNLKSNKKIKTIELIMLSGVKDNNNYIDKINDIAKGKNNINDSILENDPNNYCYIEKDQENNSSTSRNEKKTTKPIKNLNYNKINKAKIGKNKKNEKIRRIKLTKDISVHKKYILLKPQVINSITINNSETIVYNRYNKTKKEINSKNDNKIINEISVNPDYNIINKLKKKKKSK